MSIVCTQPAQELIADASPGASEKRPTAIEFHYQQTDNFAPLLQQLNVSLLVTTYQANKLLVVRAAQGGLSTLVRTFERPMGLAVDARRIALGTRDQIWFLRNAPDIAPRVEPAGVHDACYLPRSCHVTGDIGVHERPGAAMWTPIDNRGVASAGRLQIGRHVLRAVDRQHALFVPVYAGSRLQLRAALAAAVHYGAGGRGSLSPQRPGHGAGRCRTVCKTVLRHRSRRHRHAQRLAAGKGEGRLSDRCLQRRDS